MSWSKYSIQLVLLGGLGVAACSSTEPERGAPVDAGAGGAPDAGSDAAQDAADDSAADAGGGAPDAADASCCEPGETQGCAACTDGGDSGGSVWIPATNGNLPTSFRLSVEGQGTQRLGSVRSEDNVVSLVLDGVAHRGVVYLSHDWASAGYTLYDVISIAEDGSDLAVTYLYCVGSELTYAYTESFVHRLDWEAASGSCDAIAGAYDTQAELPALNQPPSTVDTGISITGSGLSLGPLGGTIELNAEAWQLLPFDTVDCTDCPDGPWYEVHAMIHRPGEGCFGILYLFPGDMSSVRLEHAVCLPSLTRYQETYAATWSGAVPPQLSTHALGDGERRPPERMRPPAR